MMWQCTECIVPGLDFLKIDLTVFFLLSVCCFFFSSNLLNDGASTPGNSRLKPLRIYQSGYNNKTRSAIFGLNNLIQKQCFMHKTCNHIFILYCESVISFQLIKYDHLQALKRPLNFNLIHFRGEMHSFAFTSPVNVFCILENVSLLHRLIERYVKVP